MIKKKVGVIGAGSFGTTVATLLARNADVMLFAKYESQVIEINEKHTNRGYNLPENIMATGDLGLLAEECKVLFPVVPSAGFRTMMQELSQFVGPQHIIIHGTKGLDVQFDQSKPLKSLSKDEIFTMSEVIRSETSVLRVGCMSGPNLSSEIMAGLPAATVIASDFDEVIKIGHDLLSNPHFFVFGSHEIKGAEFAGTYKNIIALAGGMLAEKKLGKNIEALLITRGLREMINFGNAVGIHEKAFLGTAGIGDLIATATSENSRNYNFGRKIARGETMETILQEKQEVAEGVRTLKIAYLLSNFYTINAPITHMLYKVIYEGYQLDTAIKYLMNYPYSTDVDF